MPNKHITINFNRLQTGSLSPQDAFEGLCYNLFCRRYKISDGITRYKNQSGLETDPILKGKKVIGWQAKFFEHKIDYAKFNDSLETAKARHPKLNYLILYTNLDQTETKKPMHSLLQKTCGTNIKEIGMGFLRNW